jgi:hypothetical protein
MSDNLARNIKTKKFCSQLSIWDLGASPKVAGSIPDVTGFILKLAQSFQPHYGCGFDSASDRYDYKESSWW